MERLLPVEILSLIFSYLDQRDYLQLSCVCRKFFEIINTRKFMRQIFINLKGFEISRNYENIAFEDINDEWTENFNDNFRNDKLITVNQLKIRETKINKFPIIGNLLNKFQSIKELRLEGVYMNGITIDKQLKVKLPNLQVLTFFYSTNSLLSMFTNLTNQLKVFKVCLIPHDELMTRGESHDITIEILKNNSNSLHKVNLYEINFDDSFLGKMSTLSLLLRSFSMSFCYQSGYHHSSSNGFKQFICSQEKTLEKFKIRTFDHINQEQLCFLTNHAINLKHLNVIISPHCEWNQLNLAQLKHLEKLKIESKNLCARGGSILNKFLMERLCYQFPNIKFLSITGELRINDEVVELIIKSFPNLRILELQCAIKLLTKHAYLLKDKLKNLKLKLDYCEFLDNSKTIFL